MGSDRHERRPAGTYGILRLLRPVHRLFWHLRGNRRDQPDPVVRRFRQRNLDGCHRTCAVNLQFGLGSAKMSYEYKHEVPEGYQRVNFQKDVAEKQFVFFGGRRKLDPTVAALVGKKVYLKGFMYATQATEGLRQFILLKDNGECCFGGKPKSHDYIIVTLPALKSPGDRPAISNRAHGMSVIEMSHDLKVQLAEDKDYQQENYQLVTRAFTGMVAVAGVLEADVRAGEAGPPTDFEYAPVYTMKNVELVEEAWTRF